MTITEPRPDADQRDDGTAIRPFRVDVPQADLDDLHRRVRETRWPEHETVGDSSQGVQLEVVQALAKRWVDGHDWRAVEARLNELPQFVTEIDGLDIHFIHVRSQHEDALPMIVTHGWPGSVIEQLKIVGPLTDPTAHGASAADAFDLVIPSLPGHGFSGKPDGDRLGPDPHRPRVGRAHAPARLRPVRRPGRRLGQRRDRADGAPDASGTDRHPHQHARDRPGRDPGGARRTATRRPRTSRPRSGARGISSRSSTRTGWGTRRRWRNRPQTLYSIADSPVGLAAWMLDHDARSYDLIARVFAGASEGLTPDDVLDNVTLYWLTNTAVSSARLYWESKLAVLRPEGRDAPDRGQRLPRRDLRGAAQLGDAGVSEPDPLQPARPRRALRGVGAARAVLAGDARRLPVAAMTAGLGAARCRSTPAN